MSRSDVQRLADIIAAADAIAQHLDHGGLANDLVFDAVRVRLIEIGEAVKDLSVTIRAMEADIPWDEIAGMRDHLAHRYFDTTRAIVDVTARRDVPELRDAALRLASRLT